MTSLFGIECTKHNAFVIFYRNYKALFRFNFLYAWQKKKYVSNIELTDKIVFFKKIPYL